MNLAQLRTKQQKHQYIQVNFALAKNQIFIILYIQTKRDNLLILLLVTVISTHIWRGLPWKRGS